MSKRSLLSESELKRALEGLPGWEVTGGKLHREYKFADFVHAFGFMAAAAVTIEAMNHHPDWRNVWNRVAIDLWTHDAGGITALDIELAGKLEALARKLLG
jgi:4a-hydroxytetrahydrobiopterin dehydratase